MNKECVSAWYVGQGEADVRSVEKDTETVNNVRNYDCTLVRELVLGWIS